MTERCGDVEIGKAGTEARVPAHNALARIGAAATLRGREPHASGFCGTKQSSTRLRLASEIHTAMLNSIEHPQFRPSMIHDLVEGDNAVGKMKTTIIAVAIAALALCPILRSESGWVWPGKPAGVYAWGGEPNREIRLVPNLDGSYILQDLRYAGVLLTADSSQVWDDHDERGSWKWESLHLTLTPEHEQTRNLPEPMGSRRKFKKCSSGSETLFVSEDPSSDFCLRLVEETRKPKLQQQGTPIMVPPSLIETEHRRP